MSLVLSESWGRYLAGEFEQVYMSELVAFLDEQKAEGKIIYPAEENRFAAFNETPFESVKVVIIGQDPYHGANQAHGLSFSVLPGQKIPPSLRNIYKELNADLGIAAPEHGCLSSWAKAGVLLLNATLTVEERAPGSHQGRGWERFTDAAIRILSEKREHLVFMLWGNFAHSKADLIDVDRHLVLKSTHPSPFSAHRGFLGSAHFSKANAYLIANGYDPVDWSPACTQPQLQLGLD
ncbi:Uracil-DNA glycosylase [Mariprofundus aestuarium]|uniref:Uracil-DNA glycosylase n=1 Tax=Mariprofundus aestuarium TaxID=1921086 RepID=A0A2K8L092_MARES|nr:uracil-DNA glycosylase [Mariprofundus aestuarium]ATX80633.1 Uracil-DNA glycosylase [Mariprofundus aestuarium]